MKSFFTKKCLRLGSLLSLILILAFNHSFAQTVQISAVTQPARANVCGDGIDKDGNAVTATVTARLLTGTSGTFNVKLPTGFAYIAGTVSGTGYSEANISNLNNPLFTATDLGFQTMTIKITTDCSFTAARQITATPTSGGGTVTSPSIGNVDAPNVLQLSWTNDNVNGVCVGATIVRTIVIKNGDIGYAKTFQFQSINDPASVQVISTTIPSGTLVGTVSGDTTKYTISGAVFPAGLLGTSYFEDQETITITQTIKVKGCANLTGKYRTIFGCINTPNCQVAEHVNVVNVGTGVPAFTITLISDAPFPVCSGPTTTSAGIWEFTNTGTGTCAALKFASLIAIYGDQGANGIGIVKEMRMLNNTGIIVPYTNPQNGSSAACNFTGFTSDPDGVGGFEDIDGDGIFDELPVGASIRLYVKIEIGVYPGCTYQQAYNAMNWSVTTKSLCGATQPNRFVPYAGLFFVGRGGISLTSAPSDITAGDYAYLKGSMGYQIIGWDCPSAIFKLKIVLPKGFSYEPTGNPAFTLGGSMGLSNPVITIGVGTIPDTLTFDANTYEGSYRIPIKLTCPVLPATLPGGSLQAIVQYQCSAGCLPLYLGCFTYPITPHCPGPCASGISINKLIVERTTLGFTDYTYTTKVNPTIVNNDTDPNNDVDLNQASPCDTINVRGTSSITTSIVNSNLIYQITVPQVTDNGYSVDIWSGAYGDNPLNFVGGNVNLGGGPGPLGVPASIVKVGNNWVFTFNFNGITPLASGTIVTVNALFTVNKAPYPNVGHAALIDYQIRGRFIENNISCDDYGDHLYLLDSYNTRYQRIELPFNGCSELAYYQDFWHMGYDYSYSNEARIRRRMDSVVIELPVGINYSSGGTWNNQVNGDVPMTVTQTGRHLVMVPTSGVNQNVTYNYAQAFPNFKVNLKAGCETPVSGAFAEYVVHYTDFTYTGNTACQQQSVNNPNVNAPLNNAGQQSNAIINYNKPAIAISNSNTTVTTNPFSWTFTVTNPTTAPLSNVFLSFENPSNQITYNTLEDVTAGSVAIPLTSYAGTKKWTAGGAAVTIAGLATKTYKLTVTGTNCAPDSVIVKAGWDCNALPSNPDGYACVLVQGKLFSNVANTGISLQAFSPSTAVDLCNPITISAAFRTTDLGHAYRDSIRANLPTGLLYTPGTAQYRYPAGTGVWTSITPSAGTGVIFSLATAIGAQGLYGTGDATADNDKIEVRFNAQANCNFTSGSRVSFRGFAKSPCGAGLTTATQFTSPIAIAGIPTNLTNYIVNQTIENANDCEKKTVRNMTLTITNPSTTLTAAATESIRVELPIGASYVSGSTTNPGGCTSYLGSPTSLAFGIPGATGDTLKWDMPGGLGQNATMCVNYKINVLDNCEPKDVIAFTQFAAPVTCTGGPYGPVVCTGLQIITGEDAQSFTAPIRPVLLITNFIRDIVVSAGVPNVQSNVTATIQNTSAIPYTGNLYVDFYLINCDGSGTPTFIPGSTKTITGGIGANSQITFVSHPVIADTTGGNGKKCIMARIQRTSESLGNPVSCVCTPTQTINLSPLPINFSLFTARPVGTAAQLNWTLANDNEAKQYEVEHSTDGRRFVTIATIPATNAGSYSYLHTTASVNNVYRIKATSLNSKVNTSVLRIVNFVKGSGISIYPNPANTDISVRFPASLINKTATLMIYAADGKKVLTASYKNLSQVEPINIALLASGVYNVIVLTDGETYNTKLVVSK